MANELKVPNAQEIKKDLALQDPQKIQSSRRSSPDLEAKAEEFVNALLEGDIKDISRKSEKRDSVEKMGAEVQRQAAQQSEMLKRPLKDFSKKAEEGGDVGQALMNLKVQVEALDPAQINLEPGWFSRMVGKIPGVGTPLKKYLTKYESAQTVISAILRSLELGKEQLGRDNITLSEDQKRMAEACKKLEEMILLAQLMDQKLQEKLKANPTPDHARFIEEELLFPLRQRTMDLQQQLAVNQQGVLANELIIRNNKELQRGVDRALNVTSTALQVGATVAVALESQRSVIEKVDAVGKTTSDMISKTAERLKNQGVQVHKQAASTQLSLDSLKSAFADLNTAIDDISKFRIQALPQMANSIIELDRISGDAKKSIERLENAKKGQAQIKIDLD